LFNALEAKILLYDPSILLMFALNIHMSTPPSSHDGHAFSNKLLAVEYLAQHYGLKHWRLHNCCLLGLVNVCYQVLFESKYSLLCGADWFSFLFENHCLMNYVNQDNKTKCVVFANASIG
jgi:hypothetical protein